MAFIRLFFAAFMMLGPVLAADPYIDGWVGHLFSISMGVIGFALACSIFPRAND